MFLRLNKNIKRVCLVGNQHGLLQYIMLSSFEEIDQTFFLWNYVGIPDSVKEKLGKQGAIIPSHNNLMERVIAPLGGKMPKLYLILSFFKHFFYYRIYYPLKFPFILRSDLDYWGHDHVFNAHCFLRNHPFHLLEDGMFNYGPFIYHQTKQKYLFLKRLVAGSNFVGYKRYAGDEKNCIGIYLTGLSDKGEALNDPKVKIRSFSDMWNDSDIEKRTFINNIFGVSCRLIDGCRKCHQILLTTPFSESGVLSEAEKIDMYRKVLKMIGRNDIVIKPHPREVTDYSTCLNVPVLDTKAPMQLLSLNGVKFDCVYSVYDSSALYDFPYKVKVCVLGSEVYPPLYEKKPEYRSDNFVNNNKNVELVKLQQC